MEYDLGEYLAVDYFAGDVSPGEVSPGNDLEKEVSWAECTVCAQTKEEESLKYAKPKAQKGAHITANSKAMKEANDKEDYLDYYMYIYDKTYRNDYHILLSHYKEELYNSVLKKPHEKVCSYHEESISWHDEKYENRCNSCYRDIKCYNNDELCDMCKYTQNILREINQHSK